MFKQYFFVPETRMLGPWCQSELLGLDFNKYYPWLLINMPQIPVINRFDRVKMYDGHDLEDMTIYYIKVGQLSQLQMLYVNARYRPTYGLHLKQADFEYEIKAFLRPSRLVANCSRGVFHKLYQTDLTVEQKKFIMNSVIGMCGKRKNYKVDSRIFHDPKEAALYQTALGGRVYQYELD